MKQKTLVRIACFTSFLNLFLGFYFYSVNLNLSIILFSGSVFSLFIMENPKLFLCKNVKELDEIIPQSKSKKYLFLPISICALMFLVELYCLIS